MLHSKLQYKRWIKKAGIIFVWLIVWEVIALAVANAIVLASPIEVLLYLKEHIVDSVFWTSVFKSLVFIMTGFTSAFLCGILLGVFSHRFRLFREFLFPLFAMMKAIPVAAITVLLLLWLGAEKLSVMICFLIVLPNVYEQMLVGLENVPPHLIELANCYQLSFRKRFYFIYARHLAPYVLGSVRICVGLSFKSAVAAEIIATPLETMGERLYFSKIHLDTAGVFAWTLVIVILSVLMEKVVYGLLKWYLLGEHRVLKNYRKTKERYLKQSKGKQPENIKSHKIQVKRRFQKIRITIQQVSKVYGNQNVLSDLNRKIEPGTCLVIIGASGIGKTTLLRLLAGVITPNAGSITYINEPYMGEEKTTNNRINPQRYLAIGNKGTIEVICGKSHPLTLPKRAIVFQDEVLVGSFTALTNIEIVRKHSLTTEELEDLGKIFPKESLNKKADELSGGMKRRVQIARAMFSDASILLMDEPFRGLDKRTRENCIAFIKKYKGNRILILSAHEEKDAYQLGGTVWKLESH